LRDSIFEEVARLLASSCTGSHITKVLEQQNIPDIMGADQTKWKRLYSALKSVQNEYQCSNHTFAVIRAILDPVRFVDNKDGFEVRRQKLNTILAFSGFEYESDGEFRNCTVAHTLAEAERHDIMNAKLRDRNIHPKVLAFCRLELLQDNYFHAVFEASKGLAQYIRDKSGSTKDGSTLIDEVFPQRNPILAFNELKTETEKSEHVGFATLLKGCFAAIRNPPAHMPRIHWEGDDNAADYFTLISLLYRKVEDCHKVETSS